MKIHIKDRGSIRKFGYLSGSELLFLFPYCVLLVVHCIGNTSLVYSDIPWVNGLYLVKWIMYLVLTVKIVFFTSYEFGEIIFFGLLLAVGFASYMGSGDYGLFELFLVIIAAKRVSEQRAVMCLAVIKSTAIALTFALWGMGILPALYYKNGNSYYITYGFCHRNVLGANVAILCLVWIYLRYSKMKLWDVLFWCGVSAGLYQLVHSRSSVLIILLITVCAYIFRRTETMLFRFHAMKSLAVGLFIVLLAITVWWMFCYSSSSSFWTALDSLLTTRVKSVNYCYHQYGFSLFGQEIPFVSSLQAQLLGVSKLILDNSYARLLLYYGVVPAMFYFSLYISAIYGSIDRKNGAALVCLLLFAVYGLSERYMLDAYYQFLLMLAFWNTRVGVAQKTGVRHRRIRLVTQIAGDR